MPYEPLTCTERINGETYYFLHTSKGFLVYHWLSETHSLVKISRNFFIKLKDARACALENSSPERYKERIQAHIARLQGELEALGPSTEVLP